LPAPPAPSATAGCPSLTTGVVREGELVWSAARGQVQEPHTDVQHRLGSISKTVTAVAVMRLRDEGRLDLDDPLERHIPGTPFGDRTVGQLLSHTAGLRAEAPGQWWERVPGLPWDGLSEQLTDDDVKHAAGRRFHYSNLGFGVLGELAARLRQRPWFDVVRDEVLLPLGMSRTTARPSGLTARGFAVHPWADALLPEPEEDAGAMAPAGQLWAPLADLGRFAAFLLGDTGDVLDAGTLEEMAEPSGVDSSAKGWSAYGLGVQVVRHGDRTLIGHGGSMPGFLASVFVDRGEDLGPWCCATAPAAWTARWSPTCRRSSGRRSRRSGGCGLRPRPRPVGDGAGRPLVLGHLRLRPAAAGRRPARPHGLTGAGRASRFRAVGDGSWVGPGRLPRGERLQVLRDGDRAVGPGRRQLRASAGTPVRPAAPQPGGVHPRGWGPHHAAGE
jgi:CubicO group peptidase (beta-lactamase class C family)